MQLAKYLVAVDGERAFDALAGEVEANRDLIRGPDNPAGSERASSTELLVH